MAKRTFSATIPSNDAASRKVKDRVREILKENNFNHHSAWAVYLAVEEALANAIKHGNRHDPDKKVKVQFSATPRRIEIVIEDQGVGFERHHVPDPRHEENLEKCSGRGIFLIESYMDKVEWSHGGRRVRMVRKNQESGPHPAA